MEVTARPAVAPGRAAAAGRGILATSSGLRWCRARRARSVLGDRSGLAPGLGWQLVRVGARSAPGERSGFCSRSGPWARSCRTAGRVRGVGWAGLGQRERVRARYQHHRLGRVLDQAGLVRSVPARSAAGRSDLPACHEPPTAHALGARRQDLEQWTNDLSGERPNCRTSDLSHRILRPIRFGSGGRRPVQLARSSTAFRCWSAWARQSAGIS